MRIKPLLPTLRERKRYVGFSVEGDHGKKVAVDQTLQDALVASFTHLFGVFTLAQAGLQFVVSPKIPQHSGIVRIQHHYLDHLRAAFVAFQRLDYSQIMYNMHNNIHNNMHNTQVLVRSVAASGMLHKVEKALLA